MLGEAALLAAFDAAFMTVLDGWEGGRARRHAGSTVAIAGPRAPCNNDIKISLCALERAASRPLEPPGRPRVDRQISPVGECAPGAADVPARARCCFRPSGRWRSWPEPRTRAAVVRSIRMQPRPSRAKDAGALSSCWWASSPATRKISPASRLSGPAGQVLDHALAEAEIPRTEVFVTNAVKHFKHEMRGKRRLHKRPNAYEIERCKIWLDLERAMVKPAVIVALGATAARSLFGRPVTSHQAARAHVGNCPTAPRPSSPSTRRSCCASRTPPTRNGNTRVSSPICGWLRKFWQAETAAAATRDVA